MCDTQIQEHWLISIELWISHAILRWLWTKYAVISCKILDRYTVVIEGLSVLPEIPPSLSTNLTQYVSSNTLYPSRHMQKIPQFNGVWFASNSVNYDVFWQLYRKAMRTERFIREWEQSSSENISELWHSVKFWCHSLENILVRNFAKKSFLWKKNCRHFVATFWKLSCSKNTC